jgi:hypothetical protein
MLIPSQRKRMKCPNCGSENPYSRGACQKCGKLLTGSLDSAASRKTSLRTASPEKGKPSAVLDREMEGPVDYREIPRKLKLEYSLGTRDQTSKSLDAVQSLLSNCAKTPIEMHALLQEAANLICKNFGIDGVSIGLRSPSDGLYRYETFAGLREDAIASERRIVYKKEQFFGSGYKGNEISKQSRIYLTEENPNSLRNEKDSFNRPILLESTRRSITQSLEGDYIDTHILSPDGELLGWIEISGTRTGRIPDVTTIKWIELIASILSAAITINKS